MRVWCDGFYMLAANDLADLWALIAKTPELSALYTKPVIPTGASVDAMLKVLLVLVWEAGMGDTQLFRLLRAYVFGGKVWPPVPPWGKELDGYGYLKVLIGGEVQQVDEAKVLEVAVRGIVAQYTGEYWERRQ